MGFRLSPDWKYVCEFVASNVPGLRQCDSAMKERQDNEGKTIHARWKVYRINVTQSLVGSDAKIIRVNS